MESKTIKGSCGRSILACLVLIQICFPLATLSIQQSIPDSAVALKAMAQMGKRSLLDSIRLVKNRSETSQHSLLGMSNFPLGYRSSRGKMRFYHWNLVFHPCINRIKHCCIPSKHHLCPPSDDIAEARSICPVIELSECFVALHLSSVPLSSGPGRYI